MKWFLVLIVACVCCIHAMDSNTTVGEEEVDVMAAEFAFSIDLYQAAHGGENNFVISPLSVATVLALVREGAGGRTALQLSDALHFPRKKDSRVAEGYRALKTTLQFDGDYEAILHTADKIYVRSGLRLNKQFLKMADYFAAEAEEMNFKDSVKARANINQWVEKQTEGKIKNLFARGSPSASSILVLVNAIYMKAEWLKPFKEKDTKIEPFKRLKDPPVDVPMMHKKGEFMLGTIPELDSTMLVINYVGDQSKLKMVVILPNTVNGLENLESGMKRLNWYKLKLTRRSVQVTLPKFKIEASHELNDVLMQLGLEDLFVPRANLTGIANQNIYVSKAVQKTYISVDEYGTEAAAATGLDVVRYSAPPPRAEFLADHPFMFMVMREELVLFIGRVIDPSQ